MGSRSSILNKLKALQQSQTDYADMVDENGEGVSSSKMPAAFNAKPLKLEPGMHHMEKLDDSNTSLDDDLRAAAGKANERRGSDTRKNRMAEINRLDTFKNPNHRPTLANGGLEFNHEAAKDQHLFQHNPASRQQHH